MAGIKPLLRTSYALLKNMIGLRTPVFLQLKPTYRCNMKCEFCRLWKKKSSEISTEEIKNIIQTVYLMGASTINFSGGEPLLRDDIIDLVTFSKKMGYQTIMNTNGYLLEQYLQALASSIDYLIVSLDFPNAEHDKIRRLGSAFARAVNGIKAARNSRIATRINCVVNSRNIDKLDSMAELASSLDAGISFNLLDPLLYTDRSSNDIMRLSVPIDMYISAVRKVRSKHGNVVTSEFFLKAYSGKFRCRATDTVINVQPDGQIVLPCEVRPMLEMPAHNIRKDYYSSKVKSISRKNGRFEFCKDCSSQCSITPSLLMNPINALQTAIKWNS